MECTFQTCFCKIVLIMCCPVLLFAQDASQNVFRFNEIKDSISVLDNGIVRIGLNLALGGAITYLSDSQKKENLVNNSDWGRQIQLSFYSGPKPFTINNKKPPEIWRYLGWNPIQAGDYKGHKSRVLQTRNDGKTIYVRTRPMQWPLINEPCECLFESWVTLEGNTVKVRNRLINARKDNKQYEGIGQEMPALYTISTYDRLATYKGTAPFTGDEISYIENQNPPGKPVQWVTWEATENWAAALNEKGWGIGVWNAGAQHFIGGYAGIKGANKRGGERDNETTYIAPLYEDILDHNIRYEYTYTLILGTLKDIRNYVYKQASKNNIPSYSFKNGRQHWVYRKTTDKGWPVKDFLTVNLAPGGAMQGPNTIWDAEKAPILHMNMAYTTSAKKGVVCWQKFGQKDFTPENCMEYNIPADKQFHMIDVPLHKNPNYKGKIMKLKIIPAKEQTSKGDLVKVKSISFK